MKINCFEVTDSSDYPEMLAEKINTRLIELKIPVENVISIIHVTFNGITRVFYKDKCNL